MVSTIYSALYNGEDATLLRMIEASPTWETVNTIISVFPAVARAHPTKTLNIAKTIRRTREAASSFAALFDPDDPDEDLDLEYEVQICIHEMLSNNFRAPSDDVPGSAEITPTNDFLIEALILGACDKTGLCTSMPQTGQVYQGFQVPCCFNPVRKEWQEMYALRACLLLLVAGRPLFELVNAGGRMVVVLRDFEEMGIIKHPNGKKLFQLMVQQAQSNFKRELDIKEIWNTLFPQSIGMVAPAN